MHALGGTHVWVQVVETVGVAYDVADEESRGEESECVEEEHVVSLRSKRVTHNKLRIMQLLLTYELPLTHHG